MLLTLNVLAILYEDAEDKSINRWQVLKPISTASIKNIYDPIILSQVIQLQGNGTKSAYCLMGKSIDTHILQWEMNYSEDFVIIIGLNTQRGKQYLIYMPGIEDGYMQYGLGEESTDGTWQKYRRDLQKDLAWFDTYNKIKSVESFVIRGSGSIDNLKLTKEKKKSKKLEKKKSPFSLIRKKYTNSTPKIFISGANPLYLEKGEPFVEPGVRAEDKEDGALIVMSSESIDCNRDGRYLVMYIATDSKGNSAVENRYVEVGEVPDEEIEENVLEEGIEEIPKREESQLELEEREHEVMEWEKELELREKEIRERERKIVDKS